MSIDIFMVCFYMHTHNDTQYFNVLLVAYCACVSAADAFARVLVVNNYASCRYFLAHSLSAGE